MPLDAAIGGVFAPYRPGGRHGHQSRHKKMSCGIVEITFQSQCSKGTKRTPSTQLIEATSCVERSNARMKAVELS